MHLQPSTQTPNPKTLHGLVGKEKSQETLKPKPQTLNPKP